MAAVKKHRPPPAPPITITAAPSTLPVMGSGRGDTSISEDKAENVRARLRWLLREKFDNNKAALGRALKSPRRERGLTGPAITQVLNGTNAPGWPIVSGLAAYLRVSESEVLAPFSPPHVERSTDADAAARVEGTSQNMGDLVVLASTVEKARYPKLERAVAFYADDRPARWSHATVIAARDGFFEGAGCRSWAPTLWAKKLDWLEERLRRAQSEQVSDASEPPPDPDAPPPSARDAEAPPSVRRPNKRAGKR